MAQDNNFYNDPERTEKIILAAFNSIDTAKCSNEEELTRQVTRRAVTISKMISENSLENRTLKAVRLYAEIQSVTLEESSNRYLIEFKSIRGNNGEEPEVEKIRTARMDSFDGRVIKPLIDKLMANMEKAEAEGRKARAVLYKYNEPAPEGAKGKNVPSHGYRNVCWMEVY